MRPSAANRLGIDYREQAARLAAGQADASAGSESGYSGPVLDAHAHIHGAQASLVYDRARRLFNVTRTYSMTQLPLAAEVRDALGESVRFIAMPAFTTGDRNDNHRAGYLRAIEQFHKQFGARMMKIWASPRLREILPGGATDLADVDSPWRREHARLATSLGMMIMVHVADPDTWFATRYSDGSTYGTKAHQYVGLRRMLDAFPVPWIAAHMGGWPENLPFLDALLEAHPNLHIDTSATKWVVRELSRHPRDEVLAFFWKWQGRILFGSDLVTTEDQLSPQKSGLSSMGDLASSPEEAFELYASRYWALRTMFDTGYQGESPIADPDLRMVQPDRYDAMSAPPLRGFALPTALLGSLYHDAAADLLERWWAEHP
ncbi:MAG TPA: hypothetical protein VFF65_11465 [Phycisphaerales bacterium]|nr:hypothetical protein [Phycisphaerales bacterium]